MRLGINGWRIHGQRTGVGRYLLNIVRNWDTEMMAGRFDEINFYSPKPIDRARIPLPSNIRHRVLQPDCRMLVWENLLFGPKADEDVLFCPSYSRPLLARGRTVVAIFEATLKMYPQYFPRSDWYSLPQIYLRLYEWSAHRSALVLTTTETAKRDIVNAYHVPSEKIRVVYLAPAEIFKPMRDDARVAEIRRRFLGADAPFFLFVGKMTPRRNVPKLMEAFAELKSRSSLPHKLLVIGLNTTHIDIHAKAIELGIQKDFVHLEYVSDEDLVLIYNAAEAFVLPYSYEAVSLTTLEAQATGLPVITADAPGLREVSGGQALYLPDAEPPAIREALHRIATDEPLRRELSARGLEFAQKFSWRRSAQETLAVLEEAAHL